MQYGGLLAVRNRRVSILQSNPLWGPRKNLVVPVGMTATPLIAVVNLYGPGLQKVFDTTPIPTMFWFIPFGFALGILTVDEVRKLLVRTFPNVSAFATCGCCFLCVPVLTSNSSPSLRRWLGDARASSSELYEYMFGRGISLVHLSGLLHKSIVL